MSVEEGVIGFISSKKLLNSLVKNDIVSKTLYCDKSPQIEEGIINIKIVKGILNLPRSLAFKIPNNSIIEESETQEILSKKFLYDEKKGLLKYIDCSKLLFHQNTFNFAFKYKKNVDSKYIDNNIERIEREISKGKEITIKNKSTIEFINYMVNVKCPLPKKLITSTRKNLDIEGFIKVSIQNNDDFEINIGRIYMIGKNIDLFGDVFWYTNLAPNETKKFLIEYKKERPDIKVIES